MFKRTTILGRETHLNSLAHCSNCGASMTAIGDNYVCPTNTGPGPDRCSTTPVNTGRLVRQVATKVLKRVVNESVIETLTEDVRRIAEEKSTMQRQRLHRSESSIKDLSGLLEQVLYPVEQELATYPEVAEEVNRINAAKMGLAYESQVAQDELDKLAFISAPDGLREDARNIATYLDDAGPAETMELLNIFVRDIRVGPESVEVFYSHPLPDELGRARITSDLIPLDR